MALLTRWRAGPVVALASFCMTAMGQQTPSFPGRVQKVGGMGLPHVTVRIEGAGSTETTDSGEFTFPFSGNLQVGSVAIFHVTNWVIINPCELQNGRAYLHGPNDPMEIIVLPPRDPRLKSVATNGSLIGCLIEEATSQLAPKPRSGTGAHSSLPKGGYLPFAAPATPKEFGAGIDVGTGVSRPRLVEAAYRPPFVHSAFPPSVPQQPSDDAGPARDEFLARKAKELGFSVEELKSAIEEWTRSVDDLYQKGLAALYRGQYAQASEYISASLNAPKGNVLTHYVQLASAEYGQAHYAAAESALRKVLAVHPNDSVVLNNLALALYAQARYGEAELLYKQSLAIDEKVLGPDHPAVATRLNNLAGLYYQEGKYSEAEPLFKRALAIDEKALGPDHPDVANRLYNLAMLYHDEKKYSEAESLYKQSLAIDEKAFGPDHPVVANRLNNLGVLYYQEGKYDEAESMFKRVLAIDEKTLGPDHPNVATCLGNLAQIYITQGNYSEAELLYRQALAIDEKALGPDHPNVASFAESLAATLHKLGRNTEAKAYEQQAAKIREKKRQ